MSTRIVEKEGSLATWPFQPIDLTGPLTQPYRSLTNDHLAAQWQGHFCSGQLLPCDIVIHIRLRITISENIAATHLESPVI